MGQHTETTFLLEIEKRKSLISSKNNSRKARDQKKVAWTDIKSALLLKCGKDFDKEQLQKKWSNLQERVKNKLRQHNQTGGGTSADLNTIDDITIRIINEANPILNMVPELGPLLQLIVLSPRPPQSGILLALEPLPPHVLHPLLLPLHLLLRLQFLLCLSSRP